MINSGDRESRNIDTIKENTETRTDASKVVGLEVKTEKTMCMLLSRHQNAGQNRDVKKPNRHFENVAQFRYLGTTIANQTPIREEIKRRLKSGNAYYHSVQNLLPSSLLSKSVKIRILKKNYFSCGFVWA
jgi:hypothetical protein